MPTPIKGSRRETVCLASATRRVILALSILVAGCGWKDQPSAEADVDPGPARAVLINFLEAWKKGDTRSLAKRKPPIRIADEDLAEGCRLIDYSVADTDATLGANHDVAVILSLRDVRGNVVRREARYHVSTIPALAILRSDR